MVSDFMGCDIGDSIKNGIRRGQYK